VKPDLYTKLGLTIIMLLLAVIACNHYASPAATAQAEGPLTGVQYSGPNGHCFSDSHTGDLWIYNPAEHPIGMGSYPASWTYLGKVTKLGQPLAGAPK